MISKCRFSLPRLDITGMWVFALGVWFHIVARLVYSKPWMAFFLAELIAAILVLFGAYQVLDAWIPVGARSPAIHALPPAASRESAARRRL